MKVMENCCEMEKRISILGKVRREREREVKLMISHTRWNTNLYFMWKITLQVFLAL
jgi:hypothetical protein